MKNKEHRKQLIKNKTFQKYTEKRKKAFLSGNAADCFKNIFDDKTGVLIKQNALNENYFDMTKEDVEECERIRHCRLEQRKKIENHISYLFKRNDYDLFFLTLNFNDETLEKTKKETRKQNCRRLLTPLDDYILNIDYGSEKEREHYHAIIAIKKGTYKKYKNEYKKTKIDLLDNYKMGFYDVKEIRREEKDNKRLSRYITKLTMHSIKVEQQYVSTKKGSDYQDYQKIKKQLIKISHNDTPKRYQKIKELNNLIDANMNLLDDKTNSIYKLFKGNITITD